MGKDCSKCFSCDYYESVYDGYGLCMKDAIGVMVVADYERTKNYNHCERREELKAIGILEGMTYGQLAYQKETKTAHQMQSEGWCDGCAADVNKCVEQSECEGYRRYNETTD